MAWKQHRQSVRRRSFALQLEALETRDLMSASTAVAPYLVPVAAGVTTEALLTVGDTVPQSGGGDYRMVGIPDGMGAYDNGDGTFTVLMNHELGTTAGIVRDHGSKGAFVSQWIIDKSTLEVLEGDDLIKSAVLYDPVTQTFAPALATFGRFCSADLPVESAFYNAATGLGTTERIFMTGEEVGNEGRAFGTVVSTGVAYQLPHLGRMSYENSLANPYAQDKTIVISTDDTTPGQVYVYIGTKTNNPADPIAAAGLRNGKLYGIKVTGAFNESRSFGLGAGPGATTTGVFTLQVVGSEADGVPDGNQTPSGDASGLTGAQLNTQSNALQVTNFLRPEDGHWDPRPGHESDFYFVTTDRFDQVKAGTGTDVGRTRLYRLRFTDITNPEAGGTIEMLVDGTEPVQMLDNMTVDHKGRVLMQEDPGGQDHLGKVWIYDIATDSLTQMAQHNPDFFTPGVANFLTRDEESSGVIDLVDILGEGYYLANVQAHYPINGDNPRGFANPTELVEGGQLLILKTGGPTAYLNGSELVILGTDGGDQIQVKLKKGVIEVSNDDVAIAEFAGTAVGSITINGYDGNDRINVAGNISVNTFIRGGAGDDVIKGGAGSDLILGDAGNDHVDGRDGLNLLFGGLGGDVLHGGKDDDLLIGGATSYDGNPVALKAIQSAWTAPGVSYHDRVTGLRSGPHALTTSTVFADAEKDSLHGQQGLDWFWGYADDVTDDKPGEFVL